MAVTQYIGARYVPNFASPIEWNNTRTYDPLTIVTHQGNSYTSRQFVPQGVDIANDTFWALTGNYNAQIEAYRQQVSNLSSDMRKSAKAYNTVTDMKADTLLRAGMVCHTNGFHSVGDGGAAWYVISSTGTANEMDVIACGDLFANIVITGDVTPEMFGAYGDGTHDDSDCFNRLVKVIGAMKNGTFQENNITIKAGKSSVYGITDTITINEFIHFDFNRATIKALAEMDSMIVLKHAGTDVKPNSFNYMSNLILDGSYLANTGLKIIYSRMYKIEGVMVLNVKQYGIYSTNGNFEGRNIYIANERPTALYNATALYMGGTDSKIYDFHSKNFKTGIHNRNGLNYFTGCHCWITNTPIGILKGSVAFLIHGTAVLSQCYADTYNIAIVNDNNQLLLVTNFHFYENGTWYTPERAENATPCLIKFIKSSSGTDNYPYGCAKTRMVNVNLTDSTNGVPQPLFSNITPNEFNEYNIESSIYETFTSNKTVTNAPSPIYSGEVTVDSKFTAKTNSINRCGKVIELTLRLTPTADVTTGSDIVVANIPSVFVDSEKSFRFAGVHAGNQVNCFITVSKSTGIKQLRANFESIDVNKPIFIHTTWLM